MPSEFFYVTPYDPKTWKDPSKTIDPEEQISLQIDFRDFVNHLRRKWANVDISPFLGWSAEIKKDKTVYGGFLGPKNQIMRLDPYENFSEVVIWYRSYIPSEYPLFLFQQGSWDSLQIDADTTVQEVERFAGFLG